MDEYLAGIMNRQPKRVSKDDKVAINRASLSNLIQEIQACETQAHNLGMHVSAHALNRAKNALGWEMQDNVDEAAKAAFALAAR